MNADPTSSTARQIYRTIARSAWWTLGSTASTIRIPSSESLAEFLSANTISLLVASRQGNTVASIFAEGGTCSVSRSHMPGPMGIGVSDSMIALGATTGVKLFRRLAKANAEEVAYLPVCEQITGAVSIHDLSPAPNDRWWFVNTTFSALCQTDPTASFSIEWEPDFVKETGPRDCCHLNGMAVDAGVPRYFTALAATGTAEGWRSGDPLKTGILIDRFGGIVADNLSLPHSPIVLADGIWLVEAGRGTLVRIDRMGSRVVVAEVGGVLRGLDVHNRVAVIGASKIRNSSGTVADRLTSSRFGDAGACSIHLVDLVTGLHKTQVLLPWLDEISTIRILHASRVRLTAPNPEELATTHICRAPQPLTFPHLEIV